MNQIPNIEEEKTGIEELDNLANIYGWHHEKCAGHSHFPSCPVVKLRRVLIKEQQTLHHQLQKAREEERKDAYAHCAIIREREINDILFEVADEARDTFGNGEKIIREWMQKNNCEIHPLLIEDDHSELDQDKK